MKTMQFKTNIKCDACVAKVTPHLDSSVGHENWQVDLKDPQRVLTVKEGEETKIREALEKAGYKAERI